MANIYDPSPGALPTPPYTTVFLSQRDLGLKVPINFVTSPGVSFSAACFPNLVYEDGPFQTCFANLLAEGFRRFEVDLYWDQARAVWSVCPVSIDLDQSNTETTTPISSTTAVANTATSTGAASAATTSSTALASSILAARQQESSSSVNSSATAVMNGTAASPTSAPTSAVDSGDLQREVSVGPYTCTATLNLPNLIAMLVDYIEQTENTLAAHLIYLIMNLHASASPSSPTLPAPLPKTLPGSSELLGPLFATNLSDFLYTPSSLFSERTDLNNSWFTVPEIYRPATGYYNTTSNEYGILSTTDGWPSESYVEFSKGRRMLLGYGTIDPQMSRYNFSGDSDTIFPSGYIQRNVSVTADSGNNGSITSGCFLLPNTTNASLGSINSSWATASSAIENFDFTTASTNTTPILNLSTSLTTCGISPLLNTTLLSLPASSSIPSYQNYSYSTIWSWAPSEPKNFTEGDPGTDALFRCARTSLDMRGRWHVDDCSTKNYAACRSPDQPYNWTITNYQISYSYAEAACPGGYIFAAPRTALENGYLHQALLASSSSSSGDRDKDVMFIDSESFSNEETGGGGVWVDFNALDIKGCWTTGGVNATCPYEENMGFEDEVMKRQVLVPTIAAIIVLVITALTGFVKGVGNRRTVRRRRGRGKGRGIGGGFYEGVPS